MRNALVRNGTRLFLNLIVWLFWANVVYNNSQNCEPPEGAGSAYALHIVLYNLLYFAAAYINTLWLMPRLLFRKRYLPYFILLPAYLALLAVAASHYREWLLARFSASDAICFSPMSFTAKGSSPWLSVYLSSLITVVIVAFTFMIGLLSQKFFEVSRQKEAVQRQQTEMELSLLKSQINPHFLFNVLNSIYALSLKKSEQAPEIVLKLSDIMRYMLYETRQDMVPLHKELQLLQDYLDIERIRIGPGQKVRFHIAGDAAACQIAPALLMPFVENAIKHGTDSMLSDAFITIDIHIAQDLLLFECSNNYKSPPAPRGAGGIGLSNVRKRLALIYPEKHTLHIHNEGGVFTVRLRLHLT